MNDLIIDQQTADQRIFPYESLRACEEAFVDVRIPGHEGKKNYAIIGSGVSQSEKQFVNLSEPHGFNIGAVDLLRGNINGLHYHYTSEVFIIESGLWEFFWGPNGENKALLGPMSIVSIPTMIFRGFRNIEEGLAMTVLGGDDNGGIVWHPVNLREGRKHGVHLMANGLIVDTVSGERLPPDIAPMPEIPDSEIYSAKTYTEAEMAQFIVTLDQAAFSADAYIDSCLSGHRSYLAPVIGWGTTMNRNQIPPIKHPHTFTLEWLRLPPHNSVSSHRLGETQVLLVLDGTLTVRFNRTDAADRPEISGKRRSTISVPPNAWREFANDSDQELIALIVSGGDARKLPEWESETVRQVFRNGWGIDPAGYILPSSNTCFLEQRQALNI